MKHPDFIALDDSPVEYREVRPMIESLSHRLSANGISASVMRKDGFDTGWAFEVRFSRPIVGRDGRNALVKCTGFWVWVKGAVGRDEEKRDGKIIIVDNGALAYGKWPCPVKLKGEKYRQCSAHFGFVGKERRYRCRKWEPICGPGTKSYDYDDTVGGMDFGCNIDYLAGIRGI